MKILYPAQVRVTNYLSVSYNRRVLLKILLQCICYERFFFLPPFVLITFDHTCQNNCMNILFSSPLYPSSRSSTCISQTCIFSFINKFITDPCKSWVKLSKVMPQPQVHSPGKGREALRQKVQISRLKYGTA